MASVKRIFATLALTLVLPVSARAAELPQRLNPPAPFPGIVRSAPTFSTIAPGVTYGEYDLETLGGPLIVRALAIAPHRGDVRVGTVVAHDSLSSAGERVTEMAARTGAVAGINGDYFDPATNRATNIVVEDGRLLAMPRKRYSLVISHGGGAQFAESTFLGQIQLADRAVPLDTLNEMPSASQVALLTPEFGSVPPRENLTLVALQPLGGAPPFERYRVSSIADNLHAQPAGFYLAIGVDAYARTGVPNAGDTIDASGDLSPIGLDGVASAIGGGPLLLRGGAPFEDPDGPTGPEYDARNPSSAAAIANDGTLVLIEIDGRDPLTSIGITRPELAALMLAFGARDGIAFDGGGSSAIAVRRPGERSATLQNAPSDGFERPVADGLFIYSTAPVGAASRIVALPQAVRAVTGAQVPLRAAFVDAASHVVAHSGVVDAVVSPSALGTYAGGVFVARNAGEGVLRLRSGSLTGEVPIRVVNAPARVVVLPLLAHVADNGSLQLHARAYDERGYPLELPERLHWSASSGTIDSDGTFTARSDDAVVTVAVGARRAEQHVLVGSKERPLAFDTAAHFVTVPRGGAGSAIKDPSCACVQLTFALGSDERAAYAMADLPLPAHTVALSFDVRDDGSGASVKLALRNALNAQVLVSGVALDHPGWRHLQLALPATLTEPARLSGIYVIAGRATPGLAGSIVIRNVHAVVAGSQ